jgi:Kef-type K+ transport system membrane component KefB
LEVPVVIATYGLINGLIGSDIFSAAVFLGIATSLIGPILFRRVLKSDNKEGKFEKKEEICPVE